MRLPYKTLDSHYMRGTVTGFFLGLGLASLLLGYWGPLILCVIGAILSDCVAAGWEKRNTDWETHHERH